MSIENLLEILDYLSRITVGFRKDLTAFLGEEVTLIKNDLLYRIGVHIDSACFLSSGFIVGKDKNGKVVRFYGPGSIITDLASFFEGIVSSIELFAVTECKIFYLERTRYRILEEKYSESLKLKDKIIFQEKEIDVKRAEMLRQKPRERFLHFVKDYPFFTQLPNRLCASFTNNTEADYSRFKAEYLRNM